MECKRISFKPRHSVASPDAILIYVAVLQSFYKSRPDSAFHLLHRICLCIPSVKVSYYADRGGVRRPHAEAVHIQFFYIMAAQRIVCALRLPRIKQIYLIPIRIMSIVRSLCPLIAVMLLRICICSPPPPALSDSFLLPYLRSLLFPSEQRSLSSRLLRRAD